MSTDSKSFSFDGPSVSYPLNSKGYSKLFDNINNLGHEFNFSTINSRRGTKLSLDKEFMRDIQENYADVLDSVGLNLEDPLIAYSTHFNKLGHTMGLDPQLPGKSYVFFTRPKFNFTARNIRSIPFMNYISSTKLGALILSLLDYPSTYDSLNTLLTSIHKTENSIELEYKTYSPFDPLRSNLCTNISGLKDFVLERADTSSNFFGDQLSYAKGSDGIKSIGEVSVDFLDADMSPMFIMHLLYFLYIEAVVKGYIRPRANDIINRIIDYTCTIYIFKTAQDNETIIRFAKLTGAYPINITLETLNHTSEPNADAFDKLSVNYAYNAYDPMDPRIFADFNQIAFKYMPSDAVMVARDKDGIVYKVSDAYRRGPAKRVNHVKYGRDLADKVWSKSPFIVGNKLLFI